MQKIPNDEKRIARIGLETWLKHFSLVIAIGNRSPHASISGSGAVAETTVAISNFLTVLNFETSISPFFRAGECDHLTRIRVYCDRVVWDTRVISDLISALLCGLVTPHMFYSTIAA